MQILLIRHGRPAFDDRTPIAGSAFATWVRGYDEAPLDPSLPPPQEIQNRAAGSDCVVTSTRRRSLESGALLVPAASLLSDPLFDEAGIPCTIPLRILLPPRLWTIIARLAWFAGWARGAESYRQAQARAQLAAERLVGLARTGGSVTLVGHGLMNTLISRRLRATGWRGQSVGLAYWSLAAFECAA